MLPALVDPFLRDPRPLRVLLTRPDEQSEETAELVRAAGGVPLVHPCLRMASPDDPGPLRDAVAKLDSFCGVTLASANAARALLAELLRQQRDPAKTLSQLHVSTVGPRTSVVLQAAGVRIDDTALAAGEATAEGLAAYLGRAAQAGELGPHPHLLLPRAAEGRELLVEELPRLGIAVTPVTAYRMDPTPPESLVPMVAAIRAGEVDLVPLGSPRTARIFLAALGAEARALLARVVVGAIGPTTAAALGEAGILPDAIAPEPTFESLLRTLAELARGRLKS